MYVCVCTCVCVCGVCMRVCVHVCVFVFVAMGQKGDRSTAKMSDKYCINVCFLREETFAVFLVQKAIHKSSALSYLRRL